jgi:hypothetical protein
MLIRGKPLGIWVISTLVLAGALLASLLSRNSGYELEVTGVAFALAAVLVAGLMLRVTRLYFALLLFLSLSLFLQLVAALLIVSSILAAESIGAGILIARYWPGVLVMVLTVGSVIYLGKAEAKSYFQLRSK